MNDHRLSFAIAHSRASSGEYRPPDPVSVDDRWALSRLRRPIQPSEIYEPGWQLSRGLLAYRTSRTWPPTLLARLRAGHEFRPRSHDESYFSVSLASPFSGAPRVRRRSRQ